MEDAGTFLGCEKKQRDFLGCKKRLTRDFFGYKIWISVGPPPPPSPLSLKFVSGAPGDLAHNIQEKSVYSKQPFNLPSFKLLLGFE